MRMSQREEHESIKDEFRQLVVGECDRFFVGFEAYETNTIRDNLSKMYNNRDYKGIDTLAHQVMMSKHQLQSDADLLAFFDNNSDELLNQSGYLQLNHLYYTQELGFKDKKELINVMTRAGLAHVLGSRLVETVSESTHEQITSIIMDYIEFAIRKINPQIPQFRLLFQEPKRCDIYPQICFVGKFMSQIEVLLNTVQQVLIKNGIKQDPATLDVWVVNAAQQLEKFYEIVSKIRVFCNTLDKRILLGKEEEGVRIIEYILININEIAELYAERTQQKKKLIERCQTLFDMSYAITGLDWLLSNVSKECKITANSLATKITSEIELFNLLMMCPSAAHLEWLVGHLILDISLINQIESTFKRSRVDEAQLEPGEELKDEFGPSRDEFQDYAMSYAEERGFGAPVKEYLLSVDPKIQSEGLFERIVHLWLLDYLIEFSIQEREVPSWILLRISEVVTQVEMFKQRDRKSQDLDELLLLTLSTFDLVGLASQIPSCLHSRIARCFNQLPQLFQHLVLQHEASEGFISQAMSLRLSVSNPHLRITCFLDIIRYAVHNRHFLELAGQDQILRQSSKNYAYQTNLFQALRDFYVSKAAQYSFAKHLCHIGRSTQGLFFLARIIPDMFGNERLEGILLNDLPFFIGAIQHTKSSPLLLQVCQIIKSLEFPNLLYSQACQLLDAIERIIESKPNENDLDELNLEFKEEVPFTNDSQGFLEDVECSSLASPTLSTIGRKKLCERKEIRDRQINVSSRVRKIATGQWDQEISGQELSFAPPSMENLKEEEEKKLDEELDLHSPFLEDENMIKEEVEKEEDNEEIGNALSSLMREEDED